MFYEHVLSSLFCHLLSSLSSRSKCSMIYMFFSLLPSTYALPTLACSMNIYHLNVLRTWIGCPNLIFYNKGGKLTLGPFCGFAVGRLGHLARWAVLRLGGWAIWPVGRLAHLGGWLIWAVGPVGRLGPLGGWVIWLMWAVGSFGRMCGLLTSAVAHGWAAAKQKRS